VQQSMVTFDEVYNAGLDLPVSGIAHAAAKALVVLKRLLNRKLLTKDCACASQADSLRFARLD
jgi:hypothetical protein